jgi:hypothetical protein
MPDEFSNIPHALFCIYPVGLELREIPRAAQELVRQLAGTMSESILLKALDKIGELVEALAGSLTECAVFVCALDGLPERTAQRLRVLLQESDRLLADAAARLVENSQ